MFTTFADDISNRIFLTKHVYSQICQIESSYVREMKKIPSKIIYN